MTRHEDEEDGLLRSVALQNSKVILQVRQRAESELLDAKEALRESAERLQVALEAGQLGYWNLDARTDRATLSAYAAEVFGVPQDVPITGAELLETVHRDDREAARAAVAGALADRKDYDIEYRVIHGGGEQRWVAAKGRGAYGPDGKLLGMIGVVQDRTQRKRVEEALSEETRVLEILNRTGAAIASELDLMALVQAVTDAATELSGARYGAFFYNVMGRDGESFKLVSLSGVPREAFERFGFPHDTPIFGPTFRNEGILRSSDILQDPRYGKVGPHHGMPEGHPPVRSYLAVPVVSRSKEVIGGLFLGHPDPGVFSERAERLVVGVAAQAAMGIDNARLYEASKRAAEERKSLLVSEQQARAHAERMSDLKDQFLATLSHELRTPLGAILGWVQVIRSRQMGEPELRRALEVVERNARSQARLIEDLLDIARITSGQVRLDMQAFELSGVVDAALETVRPAAEAKNILLEKRLGGDAGAIVGDPSRLQQVVWNLLSNAIKFTPKGGTVTLALTRSDAEIALSVKDNGIGIRPEFLPYVFDRFRQADGSPTRRHGGLGLGLAITKHLVELHGGSVRVESEGEGAGASFTVHLPISHTHPSTEIDDQQRATSPSPSPIAHQNADLSGLRILVVDDEADTRELIKRVLEDCGAEIAPAASAAEALLLVQQERFDLLLCDIAMPVTDGFDVLRRIRALGPEHASEMPAIAVTAFARSEDRTRVLRAGFRMHLAKPLEPSELVVSVASVVGRLA